MASFITLPDWSPGRHPRVVNADAIRDVEQLEPAPGRAGSVKTVIRFRDAYMGSSQDMFTSLTPDQVKTLGS